MSEDAQEGQGHHGGHGDRDHDHDHDHDRAQLGTFAILQPTNDVGGLFTNGPLGG